MRPGGHNVGRSRFWTETFALRVSQLFPGPWPPTGVCPCSAGLLQFPNTHRAGGVDAVTLRIVTVLYLSRQVPDVSFASPPKVLYERQVLL